MSTKPKNEIWEGLPRIVGARGDDSLNKNFQGRLKGSRGSRRIVSSPSRRIISAFLCNL